MDSWRLAAGRKDGHAKASAAPGSLGSAGRVVHLGVV
jgi:hypothetical protein